MTCVSSSEQEGRFPTQTIFLWVTLWTGDTTA
uniref:Uncharacterized protein n=1 Tax=Anguilla anguilla TaxID=7936 RepID=A0A0E9TXI6_ANGAN